MIERPAILLAAEHLLNLEGRRLAFLEAASFLELHFVSTDLHPPKKVLVTKRLFDSPISDSIVLDAAYELRERARQLDEEWGRMKRMNLKQFIDKYKKSTASCEKRKEVTDSREAKPLDRRKLKLAVNK